MSPHLVMHEWLNMFYGSAYAEWLVIVSAAMQALDFTVELRDA